MGAPEVVEDVDSDPGVTLRSYMSAMGYESGETVVPGVDDVMDEFRAAFGAKGRE